MRVLIVRNSEAPLNASINRIASALYEGNEVIVLSRSRNKEVDKPTFVTGEIEVEGGKVKNYELILPAQTERGLKNFFVLKKFMDEIRNWMIENKDKYDVIHAFDLDCGRVARKIAKKYNKKFVYHIADFYVDSRSKIPGLLRNIIKSMEFRVINNADATIVCTEERKEQISGAYPKKLVVVHNTPRIDEDLRVNYLINNRENKFLYKKDSMDKDAKLILSYIGVLSNRRFVDKLIDFAKQRDDVEIHIGGYGPLEDELKKVSETNKNLIFLGKVDYKDTFDVYSKSNIMVAMYNPDIRNHKYAAPNKIYEAMFLKKPIIVCRDTSMDRIVDELDIGFSIDFDLDSFVNCIDNVIDYPKILEEKEENFFGVYEKYSWDEMKSRIRELYKSL